MNVKQLLRNYFTANIIFSDNVSYRRVVMINGMLSLFVLIFLIFTYLNISITHDYLIAFFDFLTAVMSLFTLWWLRRHKDIQKAAFIATMILIIFMIVFILKNENSHFGIIWSIFIPYFSILFNGKKLGLYISIFFYSIMLTLAYQGIGEWNQGAWAQIDFLRFSLASFVLTVVVYSSESAHDQADKELFLVRANEKKILQELKKLSITDALTDTYNRRHFNDIVPHVLKEAQENSTLVSLFILDIDYFKEYNDTYGHYEGDIALQKVAKLLKFILSYEDDCIFRIGGEEFAGLIHTRSKDETQELIESINQQIIALNIEHSSSHTSSKFLTVSIGVYTNYSSNDKGLEYFYKQADNALYKAKDEGRNRTVFAR